MFDRPRDLPEPSPRQLARLACLALAAGIALQVLVRPIPIGTLAHPWDKLMHFVVSATLAGLLWWGTRGRAPFAIVLVVVAFGALDEWLQAGLPGRTSDVMDFAAGVFGASAAGGVLARQRHRI